MSIIREFWTRAGTAAARLREAVFSRLRPGEPEVWDVGEQEQEQEQPEPYWSQPPEFAEFEPTEPPPEFLSQVETTLSRFDSLIDRIQSGEVSAGEVTREAEYLGEKRRQIVFEEFERKMDFPDTIEAAISARDIEALAVEAGPMIDQYLDMLWERGEEEAALELADLYNEFVHAQALILRSAIEAGESPGDWVEGDVERIVSEARKLGYLTAQEVRQYEEAQEWRDWAERGIELRAGAEGGTFAGAVVAADVEAYVRSIAAPVYVVEGEGGIYEIYISYEREEIETATAEFEGVETIGTVTPDVLMARWEESTIATVETRESIAVRTLREYGR
jgi:hypothetical protein